jgi:hypothetical protein
MRLSGSIQHICMLLEIRPYQFHHHAVRIAENEVKLAVVSCGSSSSRLGSARLAESRYVTAHPTHAVCLDRSIPNDI